VGGGGRAGRSIPPPAPGRKPAPRPARRLRATDGQVLPFGLLAALGLLLPTFALLGLAVFLVARAGAQAAADAAALAAAQQAVVTEQVDATGQVYGYTVAIDPARAQAAASAEWQADAGLLLGGAATAFTVTEDNSPPAGSPASVQVAVQMEFRDGLLAIVGLGAWQYLQVQAVAGTCGSTAWPGDAQPWCGQ
jgi:hypothetical protein